MKIRKKLFGLFLSSVFTQQIFASATINFEFDALRDSSGTRLMSETYAVFIADTNKDSIFPSASDLFESNLGVGDYVGSDRIFFSRLIAGGILDGGTGTITRNDLGLNADDEIMGTKWAIFWFPGLLTAPGVGGLQAGQNYGFYHSEAIDPVAAGFGATAAMVMPDDGSNVRVQYYDSDTENTTFPTPQDFSANFTVIPEPSSILLAMFGSALLFRRRRI